ncbi:LysR family transcriptional regulator [Massilia sp. WF1]|uniref:transcriptional activator NhaR n=1 Tax=unclassified Massilia TaxID=2609279 RepID=UPI0006915AF3|nr:MULTISPECIES: transcriptional activator NhaR [unclassified Massilia]ALK95828.1 LysR family transcriptional regulator [Massilia sp. WG5]KNZ67953.1 LysR family transcriptional regulator [Massilia sp. WF1]
MKNDLNFRHLYYFWVVAKEGGITRAAERLSLAVQTVSSQLTQLEQSLGKTLFSQQGRRLVLTEAGRVAMNYADQIFLLGLQMQEAVSEADSGRIRLSVGISDSLPKLSAYRMLEAAMGIDKQVRLVCYEDNFEALLADLALHKLDVVLTDREVQPGSALKVFSHQLFESEMLVVGAPNLVDRYGKDFPKNLNGAPFLLPTRNNALRGKIDEWFVQVGARPDVVGEFEDNALLNTFGRRGLGLFFAPAALASEIAEQFGALEVGAVPSVREQFYVISNERKIKHPAVEAILGAVQKEISTAA